MKKYISINLIIPIIIIVTLPILIFNLAIQYFSIIEINLPFITLGINENANVSENISTIMILTILFITFGAIFIALRNFNKDRIFLAGNVYGTNYYSFYKIAKILGYKKISLIRKPYYIMFKIIINNDFEIVELNKENEDLSSTVAISVDESNFHNINNLRECNLIISDTYKIELSQLPLQKRNIDTIIIERIGNEGIRISSDELINKVRESVIKIINTGAKINLYMTTSTYNTYRIISDCFMQADRDNIEVEIFQQDTKNAYKKFIDKGRKVLRGNQE